MTASGGWSARCGLAQASNRKAARFRPAWLGRVRFRLVWPLRAQLRLGWPRCQAESAALIWMTAAVLATGCANRPPAPEWQSNAKSGMERAVAAYFVGNSRVEAQEFALARAEIARTGRPALAARAELLRCASRVASLVIEPCAGFDALESDADPAERAYVAFLAGRANAQDADRLPEQHRPLVAAAASPSSDAVAIERMPDPFSRLVGAAVSLQAGRATPAIVALAVDAASAQGWRRPLLAWLEVQLRFAERDNDRAAAERIRRRIGLVQGTPIAGGPAPHRVLTGLTVEGAAITRKEGHR